MDEDISENAGMVVAVRIKPIDDINDSYAVEPLPDNKLALNGFENKIFNFDFIHWSTNTSRDIPIYASQEIIFDDVGRPLIQNATKGFNCTLFAYGQTGSGKTHTMMGSTNVNEGLIPRICRGLLGHNYDDGVVTTYHVTYIEIYKEKVRDLLTSSNQSSINHESHSLKVREHPSDGPFVEGANVVEVSTYSDVTKLLHRGGDKRQVAQTILNEVSSRSHSILTIRITQTKAMDSTDDNNRFTVVSKVNLVDLAGSENSSAAGSTGERLKEGAAINKSLLTLGRVIKSLAENSKRKASRRSSVSNHSAHMFRDEEFWEGIGNSARALDSIGNVNANSNANKRVSVGSSAVKSSRRSSAGSVHSEDGAGAVTMAMAMTMTMTMTPRRQSLVNGSGHGAVPPNTPVHTADTLVPYRDSVLTYLLRESLGGNSKTTMIATIRSGSAFQEETNSTLRYAAQAKKIVNAVKINENPYVKTIKKLQLQVEELQKALHMAAASGMIANNVDLNVLTAAMEIAQPPLADRSHKNLSSIFDNISMEESAGAVKPNANSDNGDGNGDGDGAVGVDVKGDSIGNVLEDRRPLDHEKQVGGRDLVLVQVLAPSCGESPEGNSRMELDMENNLSQNVTTRKVQKTPLSRGAREAADDGDADNGNGDTCSMDTMGGVEGEREGKRQNEDSYVLLDGFARSASVAASEIEGVKVLGAETEITGIGAEAEIGAETGIGTEIGAGTGIEENSPTDDGDVEENRTDANTGAGAGAGGSAQVSPSDLEVSSADGNRTISTISTEEFTLQVQQLNELRSQIQMAFQSSREAFQSFNEKSPQLKQRFEGIREESNRFASNKSFTGAVTTSFDPNLSLHLNDLQDGLDVDVHARLQDSDDEDEDDDDDDTIVQEDDTNLSAPDTPVRNEAQDGGAGGGLAREDRDDDSDEEVDGGGKGQRGASGGVDGTRGTEAPLTDPNTTSENTTKKGTHAEEDFGSVPEMKTFLANKDWVAYGAKEGSGAGGGTEGGGGSAEKPLFLDDTNARSEMMPRESSMSHRDTLSSVHKPSQDTGGGMILKEGFLNKRGFVNTAFRRRWCVLQGSYISFYRKYGDLQAKGRIKVGGCTVTTSTLLDDLYGPFIFELNTPSDKYHQQWIFQVASVDERWAWTSALEIANSKVYKDNFGNDDDSIRDPSLTNKSAECILL